MDSASEDIDIDLPHLNEIFQNNAQQSYLAGRGRGARWKRGSEVKKYPRTEGMVDEELHPGALSFKSAVAPGVRHDQSIKKGYTKRRILNQVNDNPLLRPYGDSRPETAPKTLLQAPTPLKMHPMRTADKKAELRGCDQLQRLTRSKSNATPLQYQEAAEDESSNLSNFIVSDSSYVEEDDSIAEAIPPKPNPRRRLVQRGKLLRDSELNPKSNQRVLGDLSTLQKGLTSDQEIYDEKFLGSSTEIYAEFDFISTDGNDGGLNLFPAADDTQGSTSSEKTPSTRPPSPSKPQRSLISPRKAPRIPSTPHRSSMDAFWSPEVINEWNDVYSPSKPKLVRKQVACDDNDEPLVQTNSPTTLSKRSPSKEDRVLGATKKKFKQERHTIAENFLRELDNSITAGKIFEMASSTGGVKIVWSKKLNTTAGRANWKRETVKGLQPLPDGQSTTATYRHFASIELAEKIIDDENRLLNVIAHEFCHLANFMVSGIKTNPHGKEFKVWATKCSSCFADRGIEVTTKHSYSIEYKYIWQCLICGIEFKRHSRSIDPCRHQCGSCKGKLVQVKPVPNAKLSTGDYQLFVKENMKRVKCENPTTPHKDIMGLIGKMYREQKFLAARVGGSSSGTRSEEQPYKPRPADVDIELVVEKLDVLDLTSQ